MQNDVACTEKVTLKAYTLTFKPISMTANGKADFL